MPERERELELRQKFKLQLIQNPNYYGNLSNLGIEGIPKPIDKKIGDTTYEELTCLGYNPDTDILTAIVEIKQGAGYLGDICEGGSPEFVRFYLDYGNGVWIDHGATSFEAHDFGADDELCYAVSIEVDPKKRTCCDRNPVLPRVRAILSWNVEPPANTPNWVPVWGNRLERTIQVDPRNPIFCKFIDQIEVGVHQIDPTVIQQINAQIADMGALPKPSASLVNLIKKMDREDELAPMRVVFPMVAKLAADKTDIKAFQTVQSLQQLDIDITKFDDFILHPKFNTTYEELHCVGLDRDAERLHGVVEIKRKAGYSGDLCEAGSREYIAFYLDFGAGWEYQGTTWVDVHDIDDMPEDGLWYQAALPVNLDDHKKAWCKAGKARIRGILSWAVAPPPNQPNWIPHWGDREDCHIEIRPLPNGIPEGQVTPFIEAIGSMPVIKIDGAGFANGDNIGGTLTADDSPFGGKINIAGLVAFPTSNNLEYRVMIKGPSDASYQPFNKEFDVTVTTVIGGFITTGDVTQTPVGDWYEYIPQAVPIFKSVAGNLLAPYTASENGLHQVYVQIREAGSPLLLATSTIEAFHVDNTNPVGDVEITSGAGNCGKFTIGEVIHGTFSMTEIHSGNLSLSVTPGPESHGGTLMITTAVPAGPAAIFPITEIPAGGSASKTSVAMTYAALQLGTNGVVAGTWELDTTGMDPCGYNIRLHVEDRTIVNSGFIGWTGSDIEGFCVEEG